MTMLTGLKRAIMADANSEFLNEATVTASDDSVKSAFLDEVGLEVVGAEHDEEIARLIDTLPEYKDTDEQVQADLGLMVENYVPASQF